MQSMPIRRIGSWQRIAYLYPVKESLYLYGLKGFTRCRIIPWEVQYEK